MHLYIYMYYLQNGVIYGTKLALQHMGRSNGGQGGLVINVASMAGGSFQFSLMADFDFVIIIGNITFID